MLCLFFGDIWDAGKNVEKKSIPVWNFNGMAVHYTLSLKIVNFTMLPNEQDGVWYIFLKGDFLKDRSVPTQVLIFYNLMRPLCPAGAKAAIQKVIAKSMGGEKKPFVSEREVFSLPPIY